MNNKPINPQIQSHTNDVWYNANNEGLTMREYFAGLAMQAIRSNPNNSNNTPDYIAKQSVKIADALMIELQNPIKNNAD